MKTIVEFVDKTNISIYEIQSLITCIRNVLECGILNNDGCAHLLPLVAITEKSIEKLQKNFSFIEDKVYNQILLKK